MARPYLQTQNLELVLKSADEVLAEIAAMEPAMKAQLSAGWLALLAAAASADPWVHGFSVVHRESGATVGEVIDPDDGLVWRFEKHPDA